MEKQPIKLETNRISCRADFHGHAGRILLCSSWQTVNIGDIAHTPGILALIEKYLPESEVTLWPHEVSMEVAQMLRARFPTLRIASTAAEQRTALEKCDFFLHGSGPSLAGLRQIEQWKNASNKPYGIAGVTLTAGQIHDSRGLIAGAQFVFCRDSTSLTALQAEGITGPLFDFGPDATFYLDLRNDAKSETFLRAHALEKNGFACFVPRLRYTPCYGHGMTAKEITHRNTENEKYWEIDHRKLREVIVAWVRGTGCKALLCPEQTYEVSLLKPLLFDPLPDDVKPNVTALASYWLTDEAASTYRRAAAVVSLEMHSPIIAIANNTPAIHVRQPTDTSKGQMWRDIGLQDWLFEIDDVTGSQIAERLLEIDRAPDKARQLVQKARRLIAERGVLMAKAIQQGLDRSIETLACGWAGI